VIGREPLGERGLGVGPRYWVCGFPGGHVAQEASCI